MVPHTVLHQLKVRVAPEINQIASNSPFNSIANSGIFWRMDHLESSLSDKPTIRLKLGHDETRCGVHSGLIRYLLICHHYRCMRSRLRRIHTGSNTSTRTWDLCRNSPPTLINQNIQSEAMLPRIESPTIDEVPRRGLLESLVC